MSLRSIHLSRAGTHASPPSKYSNPNLRSKPGRLRAALMCVRPLLGVGAVDDGLLVDLAAVDHSMDRLVDADLELHDRASNSTPIPSPRARHVPPCCSGPRSCGARPQSGINVSCDKERAIAGAPSASASPPGSRA